jgi:hypothetical protein
MEPIETRKPSPAGNRDTANIENSGAILSPIDRLLGLLDRVKATGPGTWLASCPTANHRHGDRSRGLSIREGDEGRVLVHCHGGCSVHEVLGEIGLQLADLFPQRSIEYPHHSPHRGFIGRGRIRRIPWPDLYEAIERDLTVCSLAFSDLANGKTFSATDATTIAKLADHLASQISEVMHV